MIGNGARILALTITILTAVSAALSMGCSGEADPPRYANTIYDDTPLEGPDDRLHRYRDDRRPWDESFHNVETLRSHLEAGGEIAHSKLVFPPGSDASDLQMLSMIESLDGLAILGREVPRSTWQLLEHLDPRILGLNGCHLEEFTRMDLPKLPSLQGLWIVNCNLTDAEFADLASLYGSQLEVLVINCRSITNASAPLFSQFVALREMSISGTLIGDAVIPHLMQLPKLEELEVHLHGPITVGGLERLQAAKPRLNIIRMN